MRLASLYRARRTGWPVKFGVCIWSDMRSLLDLAARQKSRGDFLTRGNDDPQARA
jgi:hypothetical protein